MINLILAINCKATDCRYLDNAPYCPSSGSTLLDYTYPSMGYVISDVPFIATESSKKMAEDFIFNVLESYNFDENGPKIFVPTSFDRFRKLFNTLKDRIAKSDKEISPDILKTIVYVNASPFTWQQDYFQAFADLTTGLPIIRDFDKYYNQSHIGNASQ